MGYPLTKRQCLTIINLLIREKLEKEGVHIVYLCRERAIGGRLLG